MSWEHLVCARCGGLVVEGNCPACRAAREELHQSRASLQTFLVIAIVLAIAALVTLRLATA